jgi:hypothetical protein
MGKSATFQKHLLRGGGFWVKNKGTQAYPPNDDQQPSE